MKLNSSRKIARNFEIDNLTVESLMSDFLKSTAKSKGLHLSPTPNAKKDDYHVMPGRMSGLSSKEISRRYAFANSMAGYLAEQLALVTADEASGMIQLEFFDAEFTIRFNDVLDTRKYMVEAYRITNRQRGKLVDNLNVLRATMSLLQASYSKYDKIAYTLSREITRRNNEREKDLYVRGNNHGK